MRNIISKPVRIFIIIASIIAVLFVSDIFWGEKIYEATHGSLNDKFEINLKTGMTVNQKQEEFKSLCEFLDENMASLHDYEDIYHISIEDLKSKYSILFSEDDFEYFTLLLAFFNDIPSAHTSICYPEKSYYGGGYNALNVLDENGIEPAIEYWKSVIENECKKYSNTDYKTVSYNYNSGIYDSTITGTTMNMGTDGYTELISVDGIPIDEYVKLCTSYFKLQYDFCNDKIFRECLIFNDSFGEKCTIEYSAEDGEILSKEVYGGVKGEYLAILIPCLNSVSEQNNLMQTTEKDTLDTSADIVKCDSFYAYRDKEKNTAYIYIANFMNTDGAMLKETITNMSDMKNIIIDIRENTGGYSQYIELNVLPALYRGDIISQSTLYFNNTKSNQSIQNYAKKYGANFKKSNIDGLYSFEENIEIECGAEIQRNIYVLVSSATVSTADSLTALIKEKSIGTILGTNTHGEANCSFVSSKRSLFYVNPLGIFRIIL